MSSALITAHGGSGTMSGIIKDTMVNSPKDVKEKHLDRLISQTTGIPREKPIMDGILASTVPQHMKDVPEYHKVPKSEIGKTQAKRMGQVPYAGKKY